MVMLRLETLALGSVAALAVALGSMSVFAGCTVLTSDALPDDAGSFEAAPDAPSTACGTCVAQECVGTWAVCLTNATCQQLRACDNPLGESKGARDECFCAGAGSADAGVDPLSAWVAFASCNSSRTCLKCATDCSASCQLAPTLRQRPTCDGGADAAAASDAAASDAAVDDAGDAAVIEGPSVDRCATCVSDKCDAANKLCGIGSECAAFLACANGCGGASCVDACGTTHSTGKASATELSSCTLTSCRSACGL